MIRKMFLYTAATLALGTATPAIANDLVLGFGTDPATMDPIRITSMTGFNMVRTMFESLVKRDFVDGRFQDMPALAESWVEIDDKTIEFRLREDVTFHDGTPFTADAVRYTIETIKNPNTATILRQYVENIDRVEVISPHTVRMHLKDPSLYTLAQLSLVWIVPPIQASADFERSPVGTGPYKFLSYAQGSDLKVLRNDEYWGEPGKSESITFRIMPETSTRLAALESGEIHVADNFPADKVSSYLESDQLVITSHDTMRIISLVMNYRNPLMEDINFRKAISSAIDRQAIVDALLNGHTKVANSVTAPASLGHDSTLPPYAYDPDLVPDLLRTAGYDGQTISLGCSSGRYVMDKQVCEAIGGMLSSAGFSVSVETVDFATFFTKFSDGLYDLSMLGVPDLIAAPSAAWKFFYYPPTATSGFESPEITALIDELHAETDPVRAVELSARGQRMFHEQFDAGLPLYPEPIIAGSVKGVSGFALRPDEVIYAADIEVK